jgi:hypothetical protein
LCLRLLVWHVHALRAEPSSPQREESLFTALEDRTDMSTVKQI